MVGGDQRADRCRPGQERVADRYRAEQVSLGLQPADRQPDQLTGSGKPLRQWIPVRPRGAHRHHGRGKTVSESERPGVDIPDPTAALRVLANAEPGDELVLEDLVLRTGERRIDVEQKTLDHRLRRAARAGHLRAYLVWQQPGRRIELG